MLEALRQIEPWATPPEIGDRVHRIVRRVAGNGDPYREIKAVSTHQALALYPRLNEMVREADDPLGVAVRLSIAGNIMDAARGQEYDLWSTVERVLDALAAGVDQVAEIVSTGSDAPGTILDRCSEEFRKLYEQAELIIAKGQANYETLSATGSKVFCLLQTKCPVIARDVGVPVGSIVLRWG